MTEIFSQSFKTPIAKMPLPKKKKKRKKKEKEKEEKKVQKLHWQNTWEREPSSRRNCNSRSRVTVFGSVPTKLALCQKSGAVYVGGVEGGVASFIEKGRISRKHRVSTEGFSWTRFASSLPRGLSRSLSRLASLVDVYPVDEEREKEKKEKDGQR